jgi:ppGpp synthetase/RelA/SpoT-type nucleotidyltranferase
MDIRECYESDFRGFLGVCPKDPENYNPRLHISDGTFQMISVILDSVNVVPLLVERLPDIVKKLTTQCRVQGVTPVQAINVFVYTTFDYDPSAEITRNCIVLEESLHIQVWFRTPVYAFRRSAQTALLDSFLERYQSELMPRFAAITRYVEETIRRSLKESNILAWISSRTKDPSSLREKLFQRAFPAYPAGGYENGKRYATEDDILNDLVDIAGVRVALYFPSDRVLAVPKLDQLFQVNQLKSYPDGLVPATNQKRFSGYWATHLRTLIPGKSANLEHPWSETNFKCEIQVGSVIMHAWAEVNHELIYKQHDGNLSDQEYELLDELNGLAIAGEIVLEHLQRTRSARKEYLARRLAAAMAQSVFPLPTAQNPG